MFSRTTGEPSEALLCGSRILCGSLRAVTAHPNPDFWRKLKAGQGNNNYIDLPVRPVACA